MNPNAPKFLRAIYTGTRIVVEFYFRSGGLGGPTWVHWDQKHLDFHRKKVVELAWDIAEFDLAQSEMDKLKPLTA